MLLSLRKNSKISCYYPCNEDIYRISFPLFNLALLPPPPPANSHLLLMPAQRREGKGTSGTKRHELEELIQGEGNHWQCHLGFIFITPPLYIYTHRPSCPWPRMQPTISHLLHSRRFLCGGWGGGHMITRHILANVRGMHAAVCMGQA